MSIILQQGIGFGGGGAGAMHYKGQVNTYADLPTTGNKVGDVYNVLSDGHNYAWDGTGWDDLGGTVDPFPTQAGHAGQFLTTNGTSVSWADATKVTFKEW